MSINPTILRNLANDGFNGLRDALTESGVIVPNEATDPLVNYMVKSIELFINELDSGSSNKSNAVTSLEEAKAYTEASHKPLFDKVNSLIKEAAARGSNSTMWDDSSLWEKRELIYGTLTSRGYEVELNKYAQTIIVRWS